MTDRAGRAAGVGLSPVASIGTRVHDHQDVPVAASVASPSELQQALECQRAAMVVFRPEDGLIVLANRAAAALVGQPLDQIVGSHALELIEPEHKIELATKSLSSRAVDAYRARRRLRGREDDVLYVWVRAIDIEDERLGIAVLSLGKELAGGDVRTGVSLGAAFPVAVGILDEQWKILRVSSDVRDMTGLSVSEAKGRPLFDLLAPEYALRLREDEAAGVSKPIALYSVTVSKTGDGAQEACLLIGEPYCEPDTKRMFALVGTPREEFSTRSERERELEERLLRISAEVRAAGLIELLGDFGGVEPSEIGEPLTTRQLEIVELLLRGVRVPTIARSLYISPSTVRNHLSKIYRRYNVHSQAELLEKLRAAADLSS